MKMIAKSKTYNFKLKLQLKVILVLWLCVFSQEITFSSDDNISLDPLFIKSYKGVVSGQALYRKRYDVPNSLLFLGNFKLASTFFLFDPDILLVDIGGEYSPSVNPLKYQGLPEMSENINSKRIHGNTSLFNSLPVNLNVWSDLTKSTVIRDFGANVEMNSESYGANSAINNSILPISLVYSKNTAKEKEIVSETNFYSYNEQISAGTSSDISDFMSNNATLTYQKYNTRYYDTINYRNNILDLIMLNSIGESGGLFQISANTAYTRTTGSFNIKKFNENANLNLNLPFNFRLLGNYNYLKNTLDSTENILNAPMFSLDHQLYSSLHSSIFFQQMKTVQSKMDLKSYNELNNLYGGGLNYTKRIPTGRFGFGYNIRNNSFNRTNAGSSIFVGNEEYFIEDAKQTLLKEPNIIESSIVVRDASGTLIYQKDVDYLIVQVAQYFRILRIPNGRIADKSKVYIDYTMEVKSNYKYDLINQTFNANLTLFNGLFSLYFLMNTNNYKNVEVSDLSNLRIENLKTLGFNLNLGNLSTYGHYSEMNSNVSPYGSFDFNVSYYEYLLDGMTATFFSNLMFLRYYDNGNQTMNANMNVSVKYSILSWMYADLTANYRYAKILNVNLSYLNMKAELKMKYLETLFSLGFNLYNMRYESSNTNTIGLYLKMERAFGYF